MQSSTHFHSNSTMAVINYLLIAFWDALNIPIVCVKCEKSLLKVLCKVTIYLCLVKYQTVEVLKFIYKKMSIFCLKELMIIIATLFIQSSQQ